MTDNGGRIEPTKRQAQTEKEDNPKVDGLGSVRVGKVVGCRNGGGSDLITVAENLSPSFPLGTFRWMCGLVWVDVLKIHGYGEKTEWNG